MYQIGNANTVNELLVRFATFAQECGFVIDKQKEDELYLHNQQGFWSIKSSDLLLSISANTGFDTYATWDKQPNNHIAEGKVINKGYVATVTGFDVVPFVNYEFFGTEQYIHAVVQIETGRFRHFGLGLVNKLGDYVGGEYAYGTKVMKNYSATKQYSNYPFTDYVHANAGDAYKYTSTIRVANATETSKSQWYFFGWGDAGVKACGLGGATFTKKEIYHYDGMNIELSQSQLGNTITPVPMSLLILADNGLYMQIGVVADMCVCTMRGITSSSILDIWGEKWKIFPVMQYQSVTGVVSGQDNSYDLGILYRIVE